jgi:hypothetical protein
METRISLFNEIISQNNQYENNEHLIQTIQDAYVRLNNPIELDKEQAEIIAKQFCNMISLYATSYACGGIDYSFAAFIIYGIDNGFVDPEDGFIYNKKYKDVSRNKTKKEYLAGLGLNINMEYVEKYKDIENPDIMQNNTFYQMKIKSRGRGYHFIGCFFYNGKLYLSDTSNRGINSRVYDVVPKKYFYWLLKIA